MTKQLVCRTFGDHEKHEGAAATEGNKMHRDEHGNQAEDGQYLTAVEENTRLN
jgi:hypothetical protein